MALRIASYCSSTSRGGLELNVVRFLDWMRQRGHETFLFAQPDSPLWLDAESKGVPVRPVISNKRFGDFAGVRTLTQAVEADQVEHLIVHQSQDFFLTTLTRKMARPRINLIFSQHMHIGKNKRDLYHSWLYRQFDHVVTPINWLADRIREKTVVPEHRIKIIPRGVEMDRFDSRQPSRDEARARYSLPPDVPLCVVVARIDPKKGQMTAIEALAEVHQQGVKPHLLIVGEPTANESHDYYNSLKERTSELKLDPFVHMRPFDAEIQFAYAAADLSLMTSKSECYGMATLEAMCSGLPVIGTNDGGTTDLVDDGQTGLLVPPLDSHALADAIQRLLTDQSLRTDMGANGRSKARKLFSHTAQCAAWEQLLETS